MTTRRRASSKIYAVPLTKAEASGVIVAPKPSKNETGTPIKCTKCHEHGGTLVTVGDKKDNKYRHMGC